VTARYRDALRSPSFRRLLVAHGTGTVAQGLLLLALGVHVLERTGSGLWAAATVALGYAPYALLSSLAGVVADRRSRSVVLAGCCLVRAVLAGLVATGIALDWSAPVLVALGAVTAAAATPAYPSLAAATPQCVGRRDLPVANALATGVENAAWMGGPGLFGLLVIGGVSSAGVVAVSAVLLAVAGGIATPVRLPAPDRSTRTGWMRDLVDGVTVVATRPAVRRPMMLAIVDNLLYGYALVGLVLLAVDEGSGLGALNAALAVGALAAMVVVSRLVTGSLLPALPLVAVLAFGACVAVLGVAGAGAVGVLAVGAAGATTLVAEVSAVTLLQQAADGPTLARVFGVYDQLNVGALALGSALAGPLSEALGPGRALVLGASACCLLALPALVPTAGRRAMRERVPA
jgi:MFS family permease